MKVLVDTSVWSAALRAKADRLTSEQRLLREALTELIFSGRAEMIGPVRQELLSGVRDKSEYSSLREELRLFEDAALAREDYEEAARMYNDCRMAGVTGSPVDLLICAAAANRKWQVFTADKDFQRYARHVYVSLFTP